MIHYTLFYSNYNILVRPIGNDPISQAFQTSANPSQLKPHYIWRRLTELNRVPNPQHGRVHHYTKTTLASPYGIEPHSSILETDTSPQCFGEIVILSRSESARSSTFVIMNDAHFLLWYRTISVCHVYPLFPFASI